MKQLASLIVLSLLSLPAQAINCTTDTCQIATGTSQVIEKWGVCKEVTNASGTDVLLASKTCAEFKAFINNAPTNVAGVTIADVTCTGIGGGTYDPCNGQSVGASVGGNLSVANNCTATANIICGGTFKTNKYMLTPGGCTNSTTPTCAGGTDTVTRAWRGSTGTSANVAGVENINDSPASAPSTQTGDITTAAIVAASFISADSAADYCNDMVYAGYSDWYLPAKSELVYMFCNSNVSGNHTASFPQEQPNCAGNYNGPTTAFGGFTTNTPGFYWASTENNGGGQAWNLQTSNGGLGVSVMNKENILFVRAACVDTDSG